MSVSHCLVQKLRQARSGRVSRRSKFWIGYILLLHLINFGSHLCFHVLEALVGFWQHCSSLHSKLASMLSRRQCTLNVASVVRALPCHTCIRMFRLFVRVTCNSNPNRMCSNCGIVVTGKRCGVPCSSQFRTFSCPPVLRKAQPHVFFYSGKYVSTMSKDYNFKASIGCR